MKRSRAALKKWEPGSLRLKAERCKEKKGKRLNKFFWLKIYETQQSCSKRL